MLIRLALASLWNRRGSLLLSVCAIGLAVALLLGVEKVRTETRNSFMNTVAGTDLIVGARTGQVQLLLYSVFRIGNATNNITWSSYERISNHPHVAWSIPFSLGDSHRGYRVLGTTPGYFEHFRYGRDRELDFAEGRPFDGVFDAVLGARVAEALGYELGQEIVIAHGLGGGSFAQHDNMPFTVVGILAHTGTPVDHTVHVSLEGIEAIHIGWESGTRARAALPEPEEVDRAELQPDAITAFLLGMEQPAFTFRMQRAVNNFRDEPLMAILPGVALQELWGLLGIAERALLVVAAMVVLTGLTGMLIGIMSTLNERRREMAVLRSVGARPRHIFSLMVTESTLLGLAGALLGTLLTYAALFMGQGWVEARYGIYLAVGLPTPHEWLLLGAVVTGAFLVGLIPAWRAVRNSLADGLSIRL